MKTLEFKLSLNQAEEQTIAQWLSVMRWVWNEGLGLLIENEIFSAYCKESKIKISMDDQERLQRVGRVYNLDLASLGTIAEEFLVAKDNELTITAPGERVSCCPLPWEYRWQKDGDAWVAIPYVQIAFKKPYRQFCPIPQLYREPRLDQPSQFSLGKYFAHKRHPDKPWLKSVPANFIRGTLHALSTAWERYKAGKAGKPKFKHKGDVWGALVHEDGKQIRLDGDQVRIPKLGVFRARHLLKRWGETPIKVLKVVKRPSGFYLQLTGNVPVKFVKPSTRQVGLALPQKEGLLYVNDLGKQALAMPEDKALLAKLQRLQQQLARQTYLGKNWQKTKTKIARIHETIRQRGKNHNHKLSTFLVRTYGEIAMQEVKSGTIPTPEPIVASVEPPHYDPNGAARIAQVNQRRTALRVGQFVELVRQKSNTAERVFIKAKPTTNDAAYETIAQEIKP